MKRKAIKGALGASRPFKVLLAVALLAGLMPMPAFAQRQDGEAAFPEAADIPVQNCVIARVDDESLLQGEPIVSSMDDTYFLSYDSASQATEAVERLADVCEFVEEDGVVRAADEGREADAESYQEGADPFTLAQDALSEEAAPREQLSDEAAKASEDAEDRSLGAEAVEGDAATGGRGQDDTAAPGKDGADVEDRRSADSRAAGSKEASDEDVEDVDDAEEGPLIALVDSGAPDYEGIVERISLIEGGADDLNGHASKVLGSMLEQAPGARVVSIRVLDERARGTVAATYAGIKAAVLAGADIVNLSLYAPADGESQAIAAAVKEAREAGVAVVAAAGNAGKDAAGYVPASAPGALTAGSCDARGVRQERSNYGDAVDVYVRSEVTSLAAGTVSGWLAAHSDLADPAGDIADACDGKLFFAQVQDPRSAQEPGAQAGESEAREGGAEADGADDADAAEEDPDEARVNGALSTTTVATELRDFRPRDESAVPKNEIVFDEGGKLPLTEAKIGSLDGKSKPSGLTKKTFKATSSEGKAYDCYGVWIAMPGTSGSSSKSIDGGFTLKWSDVAMDADGNRLDLVLDVSNIKVRSNDARAQKSKHILLFRNSNPAGSGFLYLFSWMQSLSDGTSGGRIGVTMRVKAHLYKKGTTEPTSSNYIIRFSDIDQPDKSLKSTTANDYDGAYTEAVQLRSGFSSKAYIQKTIPKTEFKEENLTYGKSLLKVDESSAKFTATQRNDYGSYYRAGFLAQSTSGEFSLQWWGSLCGTVLFTDYEGVLIRDKNDPATSGLTDRAIISKSVNAYGQRESNQNAAFDSDSNHGGKRTKTSWRKTHMPWKGTSVYNFHAKPGFRVSKVALTYTPAPSNNSSALKKTTKTFTSGKELSSLSFNNSTSDYAAIRNYDIVVTTERVADAKALVTAHKVVQKSPLQTGTFLIGLYDSNKKLIESKVTSGQVADPQPVSFSALSYAYDDTVYTEANGYAKTYSYFVHEIVPDSPGPYAYDSAWYPVKVTVSYDPQRHTLSARVSGNDPTITNVYEPKGGLAVKKADAETAKGLAGAEFSVYEGSFASAEDAVAHDAVATMKADSQGIARIDRGLAADGSTYTVVETKAPAGYYLTAPGASTSTRWMRTFTLKADGEVADFTEDASDWCADVSKPSVFSPCAIKSLHGAQLQAGQFQFQLTRDGKVVDTAENDASGFVAFDEISYTVADVGRAYTYTITEIPGNDPQISYDDSVQVVQVKVYADAVGKPKAHVIYQGRSNGTAYAVLTPDDVLYFVRSAESHANGQDATVTSVSGMKVTGTVYTGFETGSYANDETAVPWYSRRTQIKKAVFVDCIMPESTSRWFDYGFVLESVDLKGLNTTKTTNTSCMFGKCYALESLDLSGFSMDEVADANNMFNSATSLTTIYTSPNVSWSNIPITNNLFYNCPKLVGGAGTAWSSSNITGKRALTDGVGGAQGYFTSTDEDVRGEAAFDNDFAARTGVKAVKRDAVTGDGLEGAEFQVEGLYGSQVFDEGGTAVDAITIVTGKDGTAASHKGALSVGGSYRIREVRAPAGYAIDDTSWHPFTLDQDGLEGATYEAGTWEDAPLEAQAAIVALKRFDRKVGADAFEPNPISEGQFTFVLEDEEGHELERVSCLPSESGESEVRFSSLKFGRADAGKSFTYRIREIEGDDAAIVYDTRSLRAQVSVELREDIADGVSQSKLVASVCYPDGVADAPSGSAAGPFRNVLTPRFDVRVAKRQAASKPAVMLEGARFAVFACDVDSGTGAGVAVPAPFNDLDAFKTAFRFDERRQSLSYDEEQLSESFGLHVAALVETDASGIARTAEGMLSSGTLYAIVEVAAPAGYALDGYGAGDAPLVYLVDDFTDDGRFAHMTFAESGSLAVRHLQASGDPVNGDFDEAFFGYAYTVGSPVGDVAWADEGFVFDDSPLDAPRGGVLVRKVDAASQAPLAGAWFDVYEEDAFAEAYESFKCEHPQAADAEFLDAIAAYDADAADGGESDMPEPIASMGPTDSQGQATTGPAALGVNASYRIVESCAPAGYKLPDYDFGRPGAQDSGNYVVRIQEAGAVTSVSAEGESLTFADEPQDKSGAIQLAVRKELAGGVLSQGQFRFELIDGQGARIAEASNDEEGYVRFPTLEYGQGDAGEHAYTVREVIPDDALAIVDDQGTSVSYAQASPEQRISDELLWCKDGIAYDAHEARIAVTVEDVGEEQLSVTASYEEALFSNENLDSARGGVRVRKVDASDGHGLAGAVFSVESAGSRYTMTTGDDGVAELGVDTLPRGSYTISEAKAPEGYQLNESWSVEFRIERDGQMVDLTAHPCEDSEDGVPLPVTGRPGVTAVTCAALASVALGAMLALGRRKPSGAHLRWHGRRPPI